ISHDIDEGPRLKVVKKEWFEGKDCLDIGCNSRIMTIHIAKKFSCRSIFGVDIDSILTQVKHRTIDTLIQICILEAFGLKEESVSLSNGVTKSDNQETKNLSQIVSFQKENFVQTQKFDDNRYDTILCLSVTKWVHLNWGDDSLITLFSEIWRLFNPDGIFVMELQPWKSYENNRCVSETTAMNYRNIVLRLEYFQKILLDK
ncbi:hypothetical protein EUTSA_v10027230mg, partial [Eutrema salsugineum]